MELRNILKDFDYEFGIEHEENNEINQNNLNESGKTNNLIFPNNLSNLSSPQKDQNLETNFSSLETGSPSVHLNYSKNSSEFLNTNVSQSEQFSSHLNSSKRPQISTGYSSEFYQNSISKSSTPSLTAEIPISGKKSFIETSRVSQEIALLRKQRIEDINMLQKLQTENARLNARLAILEHTDIRVAELGSKVEHLLQKYLDAEIVRNQQADEITTLRQKIIILRRRILSSQGKPK